MYKEEIEMIPTQHKESFSNKRKDKSITSTRSI